MSDTGKTIVKGVSILSLAGIICKLLGLLFTVPLTRTIGSEGLGIYQSVYPTYNLLLTLSSAGLPVAVSRMVSAFMAREDPRNAHRAFRTALWLLTGLGCLCMLIMLVGNGWLTAMVREPRASMGFYAIAPCLTIVCALSSFRGFMQGQQNMKPTALSQIVEQLGKLLFSLPLAYWGTKQSLAMGAAGALLGITLSEACATVVVAVFYFRSRPAFRAMPQRPNIPLAETGDLASRLFLISIPITVSACIVPLAQFVDSVMMVPRMMDAGLTNEVARSSYGVFSGLVIRLINMPTALALAVAMSLVPAVSAARSLQDRAAMQKACDQGLRLAFLIGFPCSIGMSVLARQIFGFLYYESLAPGQFQLGWELLTVSSLTVVLFTAVQATSAILQGLGKEKIPMYTLVAGVGCKILMNYILVGIPGFHIHGGPFASIVCYTVSLIPNLYYVCKYAEIGFRVKEWILKPAMAAGIMGLAVWGLRTVLPFSRIFTLLEVAVGVGVYGAAGLALGAMDRSDVTALVGRLRGRKGRKA
ncbi:MAG: polysaccharide biosynthesis protein [Clostridia bacterium]|nr:polysaccharide biosynthesis protein [Clostridia bacterium]